MQNERTEIERNSSGVESTGLARLARSPLGILSLAFVLVEGIAGFVAASSNLEPTHSSWLVLFVIFFPVLIVGVMVFLVTKHPDKLYAPSDFREDSSFLAMLGRVSAVEETTRLIEKAIGSQPLYFYSALSECGKRIVLDLHHKKAIDIGEFLKESSDTEARGQIDLLVEKGWASEAKGSLSLTRAGEDAVASFIDFVYGRYAPSAK